MHAEQSDLRSEPRRPWYSWLSWGCSGDLSERDRRNLRSFNFWIITWSFTVACGMVLLKHDLIGNTAVRWTLALVPDVLGVVAVLSYMRFLRHADELVRKVHLEAIALGFGAGLVFILGYRLAAQVGAPPLDGSEPAAVMLVCAGLGQLLGMRRYR